MTSLILPLGLQSSKYLLSGALQREFADPALMTWAVTEGLRGGVASPFRVKDPSSLMWREVEGAKGGRDL